MNIKPHGAKTFIILVIIVISTSSYFIYSLLIKDSVYTNHKKTNVNNIVLKRDYKKNILPYTVFDESISYRSQEEVAELYAATRENIFTLMSFKPERILLHEIIIQTVTKKKFDNDLDINKYIMLVMEQLTSATKTKETLQRIKSYREQLINNPSQQYKDLDSNIQVTYRPGKFLRSYSRDKATRSLYEDKRYNEYANQEIQQLVSSYFENLFRMEPNSKIQVNNNYRPYTIFFTDRQAFHLSKSSSYSRFIRLKLQHNNIDWANVVKINSCHYEDLLLLYSSNINKHKTLITQILQPEIQFIVDFRMQERLRELLKAQQVQYVLWSESELDNSKVHLGLENNGLVSIEFLVPSFNGLSNQKEMLKPFTEVVKHFAGFNVHVTLLNNNEELNSVTKLLEVFGSQKYAVVHNNDKLINFLSFAYVPQNREGHRSLKKEANAANYLSIFTQKGYVIYDQG